MNLTSREELNIKVKSLVRKNVYEAFKKVDRKLFVPKKYEKFAYNDDAIPLNSHSTISQPTLVAEMIDILNLAGNEKVLEVGTGSGYSSAILSFCCRQVYTIENNKKLVNFARDRLVSLGFNNIKVYEGDGVKGVNKKAPFDAIIFTAAIEEIPNTIFNQLNDEGKIVYPFQEKSRDNQYLILGLKHAGKIMEERIMSVRFVPLI